MMRYEGIDCKVAFEEEPVKMPLGEFLSTFNLKQLRIAETQKYAHVTYFFDGGIDKVYPNSSRKMIDSLRVKTYDLAPKMSAEGITDYVVENGKDFDFILINYANPDMVGHTGNMEATIEAVEFIDLQLKRLKDFCDQVGGVLFITADHGNAEVMKDSEGRAVTKHSSNPVFFISSDRTIQLKDGILADVAPTILEYLQIKQPEMMTGMSLLRWKVSEEELVLNSLGYDNMLKIYQDKRMFNYSVDTILLANFVTINASTKRLLDVGTNNAALSIFLSERKDNLNIDAIEILSRACEIARLNVCLNKREDRIKIICKDFLEFSKQEKTTSNNQRYDTIIANPPFFKQGEKTFKKTAENLSLYAATHDIYLDLESLIKGARSLIKDLGLFTLVVPADRFVDLVFLLRKHLFEPKRVQIVYTREGEAPKFFLVESKFRGPSGIFFEKSLFLHPNDSSEHVYLPEIKKLYRPKRVL